MRKRIRHHRLGRQRVRQVRLKRNAADLLGQRLRRFTAIAVVDDDLRALLGEPAGDDRESSRAMPPSRAATEILVAPSGRGFDLSNDTSYLRFLYILLRDVRP